MTNGRIVGVPLPGEHLPYLPLMRPGAGIGGAIEGTVLSPAIIGIATHFLNQRTVPCTRHLGRCEGCTDWMRKAHWNGYMAVRERLTKDKVVFQLSKAAVDACTALSLETFELRGSFVRLQRKGESESGKVTMGFIEERREPKPVACPDVLASLARMWMMDLAALRRAVGWKEGGAA